MTNEELEQANSILAAFLGDTEHQVINLRNINQFLMELVSYTSLRAADEEANAAPRRVRRPRAEAERTFTSITDRQEAKLVQKIRAIARLSSRFQEAAQVIEGISQEWQRTLLNGTATIGTYRECVAVEMGGLDYGCSGVMVHKNWVITSAHCTSPSRILVGDDIYDPIPGYNEFEVVDRGAIDDEVRLLEVLGEVPEPRVATVAYDCNFVEVRATIVGFGINEPGGVFGTKRSGTVYITQSSPIVTRPDPNDVCDGDSGGPLIVDKNGRPIVYGLIDEALQVDCNMGAVYSKLDKSVIDEIENISGVQLLKCS